MNGMGHDTSHVAHMSEVYIIYDENISFEIFFLKRTFYKVLIFPHIKLLVEYLSMRDFFTAGSLQFIKLFPHTI